MNPIRRQLQALQALLMSINIVILNEAQEQVRLFSDLNKAQLMRGEMGDGSTMPDYVPDSRQPAAPGKIMLFETGDFYAGIAPVFSEFGFEMIGFDEKTVFLEPRYMALGLSERSQAELVQKMIPALRLRILEFIRQRQ